jgi:hypothetical protein
LARLRRNRRLRRCRIFAIAAGGNAMTERLDAPPGKSKIVSVAFTRR